MLATAIIGSTVGVKYAMRTKARPRSCSLTHSAISNASPIDSGMVAPANHRLLRTACQNTGSCTMTW